MENVMQYVILLPKSEFPFNFQITAIYSHALTKNDNMQFVFILN